MVTLSPSERFSSVTKRYLDIWQAYTDKGFDTTLDHSDKENEFDSEWIKQHYFDVGADAMRIICQALMASGRDVPKRILDFPSGSGRVTRHLRAMFPSATIGACDLYQSHIDFCASQFQAVPLPSKEDVDDLDVGQWDLIFCGSLLTHLPEELFWKTMRFIIRSLSPTGIAIVTLEGRHAIHIQDNKWKFIEDDRFDIARNQYQAKGFGFVDYNEDFRADKFGKQESYGIALTNPGWLLAGLEKISDIRVSSFTERAWDDHQDVIVFGKPGVNA